MGKSEDSNIILFLSTYPPRECGIATFTRDLTNAIRKKYYPFISPEIVALNNDSTDIYNYNINVTNQLVATNIDDYIKLAKKINKDDKVKLIHVQHEFGIFGGEMGNYLLPFLQVLEKPSVVTLHSIIADPPKERRKIMNSILENATAIVVMDEIAKNVLINIYNTDGSKIFIIPHGIPETNFNNKEKEKKKLGIGGKIVLHSHGLINKGKGYEYAIRALPKVIKKFPNLLYLIIGQTHPVIRKRDGEKYRNFLKKEIDKLKLKNNVKFYNKYIPLDELVSYIKASDIGMITNLDERQAASGTLSYILGCGRPVISTKFPHARSLVTPNRGFLVDFRDHKGITSALLKMLENPKLLHEMSRECYIQTRFMTWSNVAIAHFNLYKKLIKFPRKESNIPEITLRHQKAMTDDFGIIQFAKNNKPDLRHGYCIDDNARALITAIMSWNLSPSEQTMNLIKIYLSFIEFTKRKNGDFANFVSEKRRVIKTDISEDSKGRTIYALGFAVAQKNLPQEIRNRAKKAFLIAIKKVDTFRSPRAIAFSMIGIYHYNHIHPKASYLNILNSLAEKQLEGFCEYSCPDWPWFENSLTYSNSKLPESLFYAYLATRKKKYLEIAEKTLDFLIGLTFENDKFSPIGQNGWCVKNGKRSFFDQQPEDVSSMVQTLTAAYFINGNKTYKKKAFEAFYWFLGKNHLKQMMYNELTGGCYDGLGQYAVNINQGAESTISYLLARFTIEELKNKK